MTIYIYARVSTSNKNQTTDNQLPDLLNYCTRMSWPTPTILEEKVSAAKTRPVFEDLLTRVRKGQVDIILAWKLDRIARSLTQFVQFCEELRKYKTRLIIPGQGIDTDADTATGRLQQNLLMAFAEFERELIRDRVMAGLERAKGQGKQLGRRRVVVDRGRLFELLHTHKLPLRQIAKQEGLSLGKVQREIARYAKEVVGLAMPTV